MRNSMKRMPSSGDAPAPWSDNAAGASQRNIPAETSSELEPATVVPAALVPEVERMLHVRLEQERKKKSHQLCTHRRRGLATVVPAALVPEVGRMLHARQ